MMLLMEKQIIFSSQDPAANVKSCNTHKRSPRNSFVRMNQEVKKPICGMASYTHRVRSLASNFFRFLRVVCFPPGAPSIAGQEDCSAAHPGPDYRWLACGLRQKNNYPRLSVGRGGPFLGVVMIVVQSLLLLPSASHHAPRKHPNDTQSTPTHKQAQQRQGKAAIVAEHPGLQNERSKVGEGEALFVTPHTPRSWKPVGECEWRRILAAPGNCRRPESPVAKGLPPCGGTRKGHSPNAFSCRCTPMRPLVTSALFVVQRKNYYGVTCTDMTI
jgi:hypothetical protein